MPLILWRFRSLHLVRLNCVHLESKILCRRSLLHLVSAMMRLRRAQAARALPKGLSLC
jgi:hypothetical protein